MKRTMLILSALAITVVALSFASPVLAAESSKGGPRNGDVEGLGLKENYYQGGLNTGTGVPVNQNLAINQEIGMDGLLDEIIHENLAVELEITTDELAARMADGEDVYDIALSLGIDADLFSEMMIRVRINALSEGVNLELLSKEQANWLATTGFGTAMNVGTGDCAVQD